MNVPNYEFDWVVETTRKCLLKCEHCLRGPSQNKFMDAFAFRQAVKNMNINKIHLTGGEPLLNIPVLESILCTNISIFTVITSGILPKNKMSQIVDALINIKNQKWMEYYISFSNDRYHNNQAALNFADLLNSYGFDIDFRPQFRDVYRIINMGNAHKNQIGWADSKNYLFGHDDDDCTTLMINVEGDVYPSCDMSYSMQKRFKNQLCLGNAFTQSLETIQENYHNLINGKFSLLFMNENSWSIKEKYG